MCSVQLVLDPVQVLSIRRGEVKSTNNIEKSKDDDIEDYDDEEEDYDDDDEEEDYDDDNSPDDTY